MGETARVFRVRSSGCGTGTWSVYSVIPGQFGSTQHHMTCPTRVEALRQAEALRVEHHSNGF